MTKREADQGLLTEDISLGLVSPVQKILFARHLALMLRSGMSITEALKLIYQSSQGHFKKIIAEIYTGVRAGNSLAELLARYPRVFSGFFRGAVLAGEASGNLELNLQNIAEQLRRDKELKDKLRAALFYPVLVMVVAMIIGLFVSFYILPKIVPLLSALRVDLPWTTKVLIGLASFLRANTWQLLLGGAVLVSALVYLTRSHLTKAWFDRWWISFPIVGSLVKALNLSRFSLSLGVLLKSGVPIVEALQLSACALDNEAYRRILKKTELAVAKGGELSTNLKHYPELFPVIVVRMIKVGEESGRLQEALLDAAAFYEAELEQSSKNLAAALEPILLIVIGLVVGIVAVAIITPIYSITGGIVR